MVIDDSKSRIIGSKFIFAIIILICSSCSLQKRLYNNGFYVSKNQFNKKIVNQSSPDLVAYNSKTKQIKLNFTQSLLTDTCDTIYTKKGEKVLVKKIKLYDKEVKFKTCEETKNIIYILRNYDIEKIHFANGKVNVFESSPLEFLSNNNSSQK